MWKRWAICGTVVLALGLVTGFLPGSSPRATVDHCYVRYGDWTPNETRCTGHWSTAWITVTGQVHGFAVGGDWRSIGPRSDDGWYEVTVPDSARQRSAVAVPGVAVVYPVLVWLIRAVMILVVSVSVVVLISGTRARWLLRAYEREVRNR